MGATMRRQTDGANALSISGYDADTPTEEGRMSKYLKVKKSELRNLLFWAQVGVKTSKGGSGQSTIIPLIRRIDKRLTIWVESNLRFGSLFR